MSMWSRRHFLVATGAAAASSLVTGCRPSHARMPSVAPTATYRYGAGPLQVADLYLPAGSPSARAATPAFAVWPVVVLIHGGYWQPGFDRALMRPLVSSLLRGRQAVWNVDYRPVGIGEGGGWPGTFQDVAAAVDTLGRAGVDHRLDLRQVTAVGHSAGGTLALWLAARFGLAQDAPGGRPRVDVGAVASLAGLDDLVSCAQADLGDGACVALMGGLPGQDDRYNVASPLARLPLHRPQLLVHGTGDRVVPVAQSRSYAEAAKRAGDEVTYLEVQGATHMALIDPGSPAWSQTLRWVTDRR